MHAGERIVALMRERLWEIVIAEREEEDAAGAVERIRARRRAEGLPVDGDVVERLARGELRTHELEWRTDKEQDAAMAAQERRSPAPPRLSEGRVAELEALRERLDADVEAGELDRAGVRVGAYWVDDDADAILVEAVVEDRDAAAAALAGRYGDAVRLDATATPDELVGPEPWQLWEEPEPGVLALHYIANTAYAFERADVDEGPDQVRVTLYERAPGMVSTMAATTRSATVTLGAPVGDRAVLDGATGRRRERA